MFDPWFLQTESFTMEGCCCSAITHLTTTILLKWQYMRVHWRLLHCHDVRMCRGRLKPPTGWLSDFWSGVTGSIYVVLWLQLTSLSHASSQTQHTHTHTQRARWLSSKFTHKLQEHYSGHYMFSTWRSHDYDMTITRPSYDLSHNINSTCTLEHNHI